MTGDPAWLLLFLLGLARASAFLASLPVLGGPRVPAVAKVGLAAVLAGAGMVRGPAPPDLGVFAALLAKEVAAGLLLGWGTVLAFAAVQAAGQMVEVQFGFGVGAIIDPIHAAESTAVAQLYATVALILFLAIDGHHLLVRLLVRSYEHVPVTGPMPSAAIGGAVALFATAFLWGVKLAAPLLVASLAVEAALGLVARAMPQMNVFIVALPMKVGVGILLIGAMMPVQMEGVTRTFQDAARASLLLFRGGGP